MAAAAILNFIYRSQYVYYCTYLHEIWQVYYVGGFTCTYVKIINKNKIQHGGRHLGFLPLANRNPSTFFFSIQHAMRRFVYKIVARLFLYNDYNSFMFTYLIRSI